MLFLVSSACLSAERSGSIVFDGETYTLGWINASSSNTTNEFYLPGESPNSWTRMIGVRHFSGARKLKDAVNPWLAMVKPLIAAKPDFYRADASAGEDGLVVVAWLLAPDKQYYEYDMMRFVETPDGVMSYQFAEKLPFAIKLDVTPTMESLDKRLGEIKAFTLRPQTEAVETR